MGKLTNTLLALSAVSGAACGHASDPPEPREAVTTRLPDVAPNGFERVLRRLPSDSVISLVRSGAGFAAEPASSSSVDGLRAWFPVRADGALRLQAAGSAASLQASLLEAEPVELVQAGNTLLASAAQPGGLALLRRARRNAVDELVRVARFAKPELHYRIQMAGVSGLRLVGDELQFFDDHGVPRLRLSAPTLTDEQGQVRRGHLEVVDCPYDSDPRPPWNRSVVPVTRDACGVTMSWNGAGLVGSVLLEARWTSTMLLGVGRIYHTATHLDDGRVLVIGGQDTTGHAVNTTEYFDLATSTWSPGPVLSAARYSHTATLLLNGVIVVLGGMSDDGPIRSAERLLSGVWAHSTAWDLPVVPRAWHTATRSGSSVIVIGGGSKQPLILQNADGGMPSWDTSMPMLSTNRFAHTSVLAQGRLFVMGGTATLPDPTSLSANVSLASVESFGVGDASHRDECDMNSPRAFHTATLLPERSSVLSSKKEAILVVGGNDVPQLFDTHSTKRPPECAGGPWSPTGRNAVRRRLNHAAVLLLPDSDDAQVLITGGEFNSEVHQENEVYSRSRDEWFEPQLELQERRKGHTATLLDARSVLVTGGSQAPFGVVNDDAELASFRARGEACDVATDCATQHCSQGLCCDEACLGECETCLSALGAPANGTCSPLPDDTSCKGTGTCQRGVCRSSPTLTGGRSGQGGESSDGGIGGVGGNETPGGHAEGGSTGGADEGGSAGASGAAEGGHLATGGAASGGTFPTAGGSLPTTGGDTSGGTGASGGVTETGGTRAEPDRPALQFFCALGHAPAGGGGTFAALAASVLAFLGRRKWRV